jgi:hypothetical protein
MTLSTTNAMGWKAQDFALKGIDGTSAVPMGRNDDELRQPVMGVAKRF